MKRPEEIEGYESGDAFRHLRRGDGSGRTRRRLQ
jgi:hypothetical protein